MRIAVKYISIFLFSFLFVGCSFSSQTLDTKEQLNLPKEYNDIENKLNVNENWLLAFNNPVLVSLVNSALNKNFKLKQLYHDIDIAKQNLMASKSYLFPSLNSTLNNEKEAEVGGITTQSIAKFDLTLNYEIDLWNKLSDNNKKANMQLLESKAIYEEGKQQLIRDVIIAYFNIIESNRLLDVYTASLENKKEQAELIQSKYKKGLISALDTYESSNSILDQVSKISEQQSIKSNAIYTLENLLGTYPKGMLDMNESLPLFNSNIKLGLPSDLIQRKSSLSASWSRLLAQNYQLAFTHKQRLPSLNLSASLVDSSAAPLTWSLLGALTAPLFNAGRLKANENIEMLNLKKLELAYLGDVHNAYLDIETLLVQEKSLKEQYKSLVVLKKNANSSSQLIYSQYLKGLSEFSNVLKSQSTYYDAKSSVIQIKKKLIEIRVNLHLALGGDFTKETNPKETKQ